MARSPRQTGSTCALLPRREAPRLRTPSSRSWLPSSRRLEAREVARSSEPSLGGAAAQRDWPWPCARDLQAARSALSQESSLAHPQADSQAKRPKTSLARRSGLRVPRRLRTVAGEGKEGSLTMSLRFGQRWWRSLQPHKAMSISMSVHGLIRRFPYAGVSPAARTASCHDPKSLEAVFGDGIVRFDSASRSRGTRPNFRQKRWSASMTSWRVHPSHDAVTRLDLLAIAGP